MYTMRSNPVYILRYKKQIFPHKQMQRNIFYEAYHRVRYFPQLFLIFVIEKTDLICAAVTPFGFTFKISSRLIMLSSKKNIFMA